MTKTPQQTTRPRGYQYPNPLITLKAFGVFLAILVLMSSSALFATPTAHNISAGYIQLTNTPGNDTVTTSSLQYSINDFRLVSASKGTANIQIGASLSDDATNGIMMSSIPINITTNNPQTNPPTAGAFTNNYNISMIETNSNGSYHLAVYQSGNTGLKENCDVVGAYFPYSKFIGGHARSSEPYTNGNPNANFTGSPGMINGVNYFDWRLITNGPGGVSTVDLRPFGISSLTDGVLIVNHGKDRAGDGNYAVSQAAPDGTWTTRVRDHNGGGEQDPIAFVFIPKTNTTVVSGKFKGTDPDNNLILMYSGNTPAFNVVNIGTGRWNLKIPGYGPTNGVLILSGEGGGSQNADNCTTYQPLSDNSGWEIQSRDLAPGGLQTPGAGADPICDFVFIPGATPGITVSPTNNLQTSETGGTATFTVVLDTKPTANVTIGVSSSDTTEGTVSVSSLTFTPANFGTPQTVTITGVDDPDQDGTVPYTIVLAPATSTDPTYNGVNPADVSVVNIDNEPGITFSKNNLTTTEAGGTDSFTAVLNTQPTDDVTFNISSSNTSEGTVSPATLTFTAANWNTPQTVTVTGVNDSVDDGDVAYTIVTSAATSTDPIYNGFNPLDLAAVNVDDDTAGFVFSSPSLTVAEGGTGTNFTVALASQPTASVTVNISSADSTEGTITPASRTFTTANWATPQSFTLNPVDDAVADGNITYNLNVSATSSDTVYAAKTATVSATTLDNEAGITLPSGTVYYGIGQPAVGIDGQATVTDIDSTTYNSGSLTFALTANATANDHLEIRNDGTDTNQVSVSGNVVSVGGVSVGTFTGGVGTSPLIVSFNSGSSPAAAQAIIRAVTYRNVTNAPSTADRTLTVTLADGVGGTSTASKIIRLSLVTVADFQDGVDHGFGVYTNEVDIELNGLQPDNSYPAGFDPVNGLQVIGGSSQILLRFGNIVGNSPNQIPANAIVVSADLMLNATVSGQGSPLYRMLVPFDGQGDTYNGFGFGVDQDGIESSSNTFSQFGTLPVSGASSTGNLIVSVLPDVQAWVNGEANNGWVLPGYGTRTCFTPSESTNLANHPRLTVKWVPAGTASASFRQGVNGYTNALDTSIRQADPSGNHAADTGLFCDGEVTSPLNDPAEPLLRFANIFGNSPGQVPPGSIIQSAILDIGSLVGDAMGDGGHVHAMLAPWTDTDTWNTLVNGIQTDGVEAMVNPTFTAGNSGLNPDVQGGYLEFDVTSDVQAWAAGGRPNYGWAFIPWVGGGNGWGFASSENVNIGWRPQLRIYYTAGVVVTPIHITSITRGPTSATLVFTGAASSSFTVLRSATVNGTYTSVGSASTNGSGNGTFVDNAPLPGAAFYRIQGQ